MKSGLAGVGLDGQSLSWVHQTQCCLPSKSDNTPTEGEINNLFTTSWPLSVFLGLIASWSSANGVHLQVSHVAGAHNQWADGLSRGQLQAFAHMPQERLGIAPGKIASAAFEASWTPSGGWITPLFRPKETVDACMRQPSSRGKERVHILTISATAQSEDRRTARGGGLPFAPTLTGGETLAYGPASRPRPAAKPNRCNTFKKREHLVLEQCKPK